jgi:hypothetical protein
VIFSEGVLLRSLAGLKTESERPARFIPVLGLVGVAVAALWAGTAHAAGDLKAGRSPQQHSARVASQPPKGGSIRISLLPGGVIQTISVPSGDAFYTLPVPPGATPKEFVAKILVRGPVTGGVATVTTPTTAFPVDLQAVNGVSQLAVPLASSDVQDGEIPLQLHVDLTLALNPSVCTPPPAVVAQIVSAGGIFGGSLRTPTSPADFWPKTLRSVIVWLPRLVGLPDADKQAVAQASLQVSALVAQQYGAETKVRFRTGTPSPHQISPVSRDVALVVQRSGPVSQVRVEETGTAPVLIVAGRGEGLEAAARAVGTNGLFAATARAASAVTSSPFTPNPAQVTVTQAGTREITLAQLGWPTSLRGVGTTSITESLPQAQFDGAIHSLQLRLQGSYTPPPQGGVATFSALVNGYLVLSERLGPSGVLGATADVPQSVLARVQTIVFRLDYAPPGGVCHVGLLPLQITLNPASGFLATPGQTLAPGFSRFPQNVAARLPVDLITLDDTTLVAGCRLVAALSELLPSPPNVELLPSGSGASRSRTVVIVGARPSLARKLGAPLQLAPFRSIAAQGVEIGYEVDQPFAALEAFSQKGRDVLLLGTFGEPRLLDTLTAQLRRSRNGWFSLGSGQLAVSTADGRLRVLRAAALLPQLAGSSGGGGGIGVPGWLTIALIVAGALIGARLAWLAARMALLRRRARSAEQAGDGKSGEE